MKLALLSAVVLGSIGSVGFANAAPIPSAAQATPSVMSGHGPVLTVAAQQHSKSHGHHHKKSKSHKSKKHHKAQ